MSVKDATADANLAKEKKKAFISFYQEDKTQKMTGCMRVIHGKVVIIIINFF